MSDLRNQASGLSDPLHEAYALMKAEQWEEAMAVLSALMARDDIGDLTVEYPGLIPETLSLLGVTVYRLGNLAEAIALFNRILDMPGASSDVAEVLAVLYALAGRLTDALFHGKLATTRPCDNKILDLFGPNFPNFADVFMNINEKPLVKLGRHELQGGDAEVALSHFDQQLSLDERDSEALEGKARALLALEKGRNAVQVLRYLRQLAPDDVSVVSLLATALSLIGEVFEAQACHRLAVAMAPDNIAIAASWLRDASVFPGEADVLCRRAHEALVCALECEEEENPRPVPSLNAPIKIGYLVVDLLPEQAKMIGKVLLWQEGPIILYGNGDLSSSLNKPFQGVKAIWRDVTGLDGYTFAEVVRGDEVTVLVNASGWRAPEYLQAHPQRPAPVQVSWMNGSSRNLFPGIDWHLGGKGDGCWELPHGAYTVNLDTIPKLSRSVERGAALTFGVNTTIAHITPDVALCWARLLLKKPEARLVLQDRDLSHPQNRQRLVDLFGDFGVAHRIEIADEADMAVFMAGIDLLLLPFREAQFAKAAAALIQGVPVIALDQSGLEIASFLKAAGVDGRMLATDEDDYIAKGKRLCEDGEYRRILEKEAQGGLLTCPIFDMQGMAEALTGAFKRMVADVSA